MARALPSIASTDARPASPAARLEPSAFWSQRRAAIAALLASVPQRDICELLGVNRRRLMELEGAGLPRVKRDGRAVLYDLGAVMRWLVAREAPAEAPSDSAPGSLASESELRAEKLRQLRRENSLAEGTLVRRDAVVRTVDEQTLAFREGLQDVDERLAVALGRCKSPAERQEMLASEHAKLCQRFSLAMKEAI